MNIYGWCVFCFLSSTSLDGMQISNQKKFNKPIDTCKLQIRIQQRTAHDREGEREIEVVNLAIVLIDSVPLSIRLAEIFTDIYSFIPLALHYLCSQWLYDYAIFIAVQINDCLRRNQDACVFFAYAVGMVVVSCIGVCNVCFYFPLRVHLNKD